MKPGNAWEVERVNDHGQVRRSLGPRRLGAKVPRGARFVPRLDPDQEPPMNVTRKAFCASLAGATATLWLQGCGGGGSYSAGSTPPAASSTCGASGSDITNNHGHALTILKADLDLTVNKTYTLSPSVEGHVHDVTFTPAQLALLKAGSSVTVTSTTTVASSVYGGTHSHSVTATVMATCP
jgi:hypothetical protein